MLSEKVINQMQEIADDCMGDAPPFCEARCPLHIEVQKYVRLIAEGKYRKALQVIRAQTPFPGILGRVCAHPCEEECKRVELEGALSIKNLKRFVADSADDPRQWDTEVEKSSGKKVAVIGSGPAGATAAYELRKKGHEVVIFEKLPVVGGMLRVGIPSYRLPHEIIEREYEILEKAGVEIKLNTEVGKDISFSELEKKYDAVFVGVGAHKSVIIPVEGKELEGVLSGTDFLCEVDLGKEVDIGKKVVVIGGGNVAMDVARTAWRIGAEEIDVVCLEGCCNEMPAHLWEIDDAKEEGIRMNPSWGPKKIEGTDSVEGITLKKCVRVFDDEGNFNPQYDEQDQKTIDADNIIFAVGQKTEAPFIGSEGVFSLENIDPVTLQSDKKNVFVGGDCAGTVLAVEAMAHGKKAAISIDRYLKGEDLRKNREYEDVYETWLEKDLDEDEPKRYRIEMPMLPVEERKGNFREVELGFSPAEARGEAERCLECECKLCMEECEMLPLFCEYPKELFSELLEEDKQLDPLIPYSCTMCGQCTIECPKDFELSDRFMEIRRQLIQENDGKPPLKGHNAIQMHQKMAFSRLFCTAKPAKNEEGDQ